MKCIGSESPERYRAAERGALLLEVVIALTIMVAAMGILGGQLVRGLRMTEYADQQTRASQFADRMLGLLELDRELLARFGEEDVVDGDFGDAYPGWFWRVQIEPTDVEELGRVTMEVLHVADPERSRSIEDARVVRRLHMLKAAPTTIDLQSDFGVSEEQLTQFTEMLPIPDFDPENFDPQEFAELITPETLMQFLPALLPLIQQMSGGVLPPNATPEDIADLLGQGGLPQGGELPDIPGFPGSQRGGGNAGGTDALRDMIRDALGDQISDEELDEALSGVGSSTGTGGRRNIRDLDSQRDQRIGGDRSGGRRP